MGRSDHNPIHWIQIIIRHRVIVPFFDDVCKRSACFILECVQSDSLLVRSIARFGIVAGFGNSVIVRNVVFLCSYFGWQFNEFVQGRISLSNAWFLSHFYEKVTHIVIDVQLCHYWISSVFAKVHLFLSSLMIVHFLLKNCHLLCCAMCSDEPY